MATLPARKTGGPMRDAVVTRSRSVAGQVFLSPRRDAIVDRDEHLAEATMRAHLRNVYRSIEQFTTSHHAFFEGESIERPSPLDRSAAGKLRNRGATDEAR